MEMDKLINNLVSETVDTVTNVGRQIKDFEGLLANPELSMLTHKKIEKSDIIHLESVENSELLALKPESKLPSGKIREMFNTVCEEIRHLEYIQLTGKNQIKLPVIEEKPQPKADLAEMVQKFMTSMDMDEINTLKENIEAEMMRYAE